MKFLAYLRAFSALGSHPARSVSDGQTTGSGSNSSGRVIIDLSPFWAIRDDDFSDIIGEDSNSPLQSLKLTHNRFRPALGGGRSIQLSYTDIFNFWLISGLFGSPASRPVELRVTDNCSLWRQVVKSPLPPRGCTCKCREPLFGPESNRIRTRHRIFIDPACLGPPQL